jgi:hypothetical protein
MMSSSCRRAELLVEMDSGSAGPPRLLPRFARNVLVAMRSRSITGTGYILAEILLISSRTWSFVGGGAFAQDCNPQD